MDGFVVLSTTETDGELWLLVETMDTVMGCANCGVRAVGHGRSEVQVRDLAIGGRPVRLVWRKRRWLCQDEDCPTKSFTAGSELVEGCLTRRAAREICRLVGEVGLSVASVARNFGVGWHTAWQAVERHGRPLVDDPRRLHGVRALGVDEHKMLAAGPTHHTIYATQLVDIDRHVLLDVVKDRSAASVSGWLSTRTRYFRDHISVAAIDPHAGYFKALRSQLPKATVTVDVFHAVKLANACVDDVRRRVQRETTSHRGRNEDPLYGIRRLLTRGYERLSDKQRARVEDALRRGDPYDEVGGAWAVKEQLRSVYDSDSLEGATRSARHLLRAGRHGGDVRGPPTGEDHQALGGPGTRLLHHRPHQRQERSHEPHHREAPPQRPRHPEFQQLSAPALAPLRRPMEHSVDCSNQRSSPTPRSCRASLRSGMRHRPAGSERQNPRDRPAGNAGSLDGRLRSSQVLVSVCEQSRYSEGTKWTRTPKGTFPGACLR